MQPRGTGIQDWGTLGPGCPSGGESLQGPPQVQTGPLTLRPGRVPRPARIPPDDGFSRAPPTPAISVLVSPHSKGHSPQWLGFRWASPCAPGPPSTCLQPWGALPPHFSRASCRGCAGGGRRGFLGLPAPPPPRLSPFPPPREARLGHCSNCRLLPSRLASPVSYPTPTSASSLPPPPASARHHGPQPPALSPPLCLQSLSASSSPHPLLRTPPRCITALGTTGPPSAPPSPLHSCSIPIALS